MRSELTLNLKCPACGSLTPKSLTEIKAQKAFDCECGYHADIQAQSMASFLKHKREKAAIPA
jgi:hypothetical protein